MAGDADAAREWREAYERVSGLVATTQLRDPGALERAVPATPDWRARDLVAHMIGVGSDTLGDAVDEEHGEDWTQRHVEARRDHAVPQLLEEWSGLAGRIEEHVATTDPGPLGDVVIHEQDLRGALGTPGGRSSAGLAMVREQMAATFADGLEGRGPVRLEATDEDWWWQSADGDPAVVLRAPGYDLARALTARRTAEQLRSYVTAGDVTPFLDDFAGLGPLPTEALPE